MGPRRNGADEDQVPAMGRYRARNQYELVLRKQGVSETLLAGAGDSIPQPVGVGNSRHFDDVNACRINYRCACPYMRDAAQARETLLHRDLNNTPRPPTPPLSRPPA